jgi:hypothetical protein
MANSRLGIPCSFVASFWASAAAEAFSYIILPVRLLCSRTQRGTCPAFDWRWAIP